MKEEKIYSAKIIYTKHGKLFVEARNGIVLNFNYDK